MLHSPRPLPLQRLLIFGLGMVAILPCSTYPGNSLTDILNLDVGYLGSHDALPYEIGSPVGTQPYPSCELGYCLVAYTTIEVAVYEIGIVQPGLYWTWSKGLKTDYNFSSVILFIEVTLPTVQLYPYFDFVGSRDCILVPYQFRVCFV